MKRIVMTISKLKEIESAAARTHKNSWYISLTPSQRVMNPGIFLERLVGELSRQGFEAHRWNNSGVVHHTPKEANNGRHSISSISLKKGDKTFYVHVHHATNHNGQIQISFPESSPDNTTHAKGAMSMWLNAFNSGKLTQSGSIRKR